MNNKERKSLEQACKKLMRATAWPISFSEQDVKAQAAIMANDLIASNRQQWSCRGTPISLANSIRRQARYWNRQKPLLNPYFTDGLSRLKSEQTVDNGDGTYTHTYSLIP